eukprot:650638-Pelagomonas_calceolata.AAC.1
MKDEALVSAIMKVHTSRESTHRKKLAVPQNLQDSEDTTAVCMPDIKKARARRRTSCAVMHGEIMEDVSKP